VCHIQPGQILLSLEHKVNLWRVMVRVDGETRYIRIASDHTNSRDLMNELLPPEAEQIELTSYDATTSLMWVAEAASLFQVLLLGPLD